MSPFPPVDALDLFDFPELDFDWLFAAMLFVAMD